MQTQAYIDEIRTLLDKVEQQSALLHEVGLRIVDTVQSGHSIFAFGCTHAGILAQELFYRTGGLAIINPLLPDSLNCDVKPMVMTSDMERLEGYGNIIARHSHLAAGDLLIIHSVSGRNAVPVELALAARGMGVFVVALTNLAYSKASSSRHSSGKRLFEVADTVIDNGGCFGDAALSIGRFPQKVSPTSTVIGAAIVNAIVAEAVEVFGAGITPPVYMSANIDGGDAFNARIMQEYKDHIYYL